MRSLVWLGLVAATEVTLHTDEGEGVESDLAAELVAVDEPEEEEINEDNRQAKHYAAFVMSTITGRAVSEYSVPRDDCAKLCDEKVVCEGFITEGSVCQLMASRNVVAGRSAEAAAAHQAEFAYVKRAAMPMEHAVVAGFTRGWMHLTDSQGRATKATDGNPWMTMSLPTSLDFDLKYSAMFTSITIHNAIDPLHLTGADQVEVYAQGADGWVRVAKFRLKVGESATVPVEPCHTRFVRVKFMTFHGDPGAVNMTKLTLNGGIGINPQKLKAHAEAREAHAKLQAEEQKEGGMLECPILSTYPHPTLAQLSTWAVHQPECMCAEVTNEQTVGQSDAVAQAAINAWSVSMKSGAQFASEHFAPLWSTEDVNEPARFHYKNASDAYAGLGLNKTDWTALKNAESTGVPPPLKFYLFKPLATRGRVRGVQLGDLHFYFRGESVDTAGVTAKALAGSAGDSPPANLFDNDPSTMYYNTQADAAIEIEFPRQVVIDSFTLSTSGSKPDADPVVWTLMGGYDGSGWPFMLSNQEIEGDVPVERLKESAPIRVKAELLEKPEEDEGKASENGAMQQSWHNVAYELGQGQEHLYDEQVTAQCIAMSCLSHTLASASSGCVQHLAPLCEEFAARTGCDAQCDGSKKTSCVQITKQTAKHTGWLSGVGEDAEKLRRERTKKGYGKPKPKGEDEGQETSLGENHLRLVEVTPSGQAREA